MAAFRELATRAGVCVAREDSVLSTAADEDFDAVVMNVERAGGSGADVHVVVCFCEGMTVRGLLAALKRKHLAGGILIIGSDGWADRSDVVQDYEQEAHGSISVRIHSPYVHSFDHHYFQLRPETNFRNPWFREFWQAKFQCRLPEEKEPIHGELNGGNLAASPMKYCNGDETLRMRYRQDPKLNFVIKAIYTMAHALHNMQKELCGAPEFGACSAMFPFNGTLFKAFLMNTSFITEEGENVEFDQHGDPPGRYEIINYQKQPNGSYQYVHVGDWVGGNLSFRKPMQFAGAAHRQITTNPAEVHSVCSQPCHTGSYKNFQSGGPEKRCCWVCVPCDKHEILYNETTCVPCPDGWYPNDNKSICLQSPIEYMKWTDSEAIVAMSFAFFGFGVTAFTASVFIRHNNTPVVKSSTRELSYLILFGMMMSHAATFPILAQPSVVSCTLSRTMPGVSFAIIYGSLLTKTNRIARILAGSKKRFPTRKPRFMSGTAQLLMSFALIGLEGCVAGWMVWRESAAPALLHPSRARSALACASSARAVLVPLAAPGALVALCTLYAVRTRAVPANFNEAKFIGFAMYTTCVIWVAFVPIYFGSESKIITKCICVSLSAMVTLVFLFMPKLYIIIFRPEKNNRALFTTSKSIRCHIGSRVASAISNKSTNSFSSSRDVDSPHMKRKKAVEEDTSTTSCKSMGKAGDRKSQNVNWKDEQFAKAVPTENELKPELRTLSCQTSSELLFCLLKGTSEAVSPPTNTNVPDWVELNPKSLLSGYPAQDEAINPIVKRSKQTLLLHPKARIREESVSECSLSDEDSVSQIKSITITLGSVNSIG